MVKFHFKNYGFTLHLAELYRSPSSNDEIH